jgi:hypothetical protein
MLIHTCVSIFFLIRIVRGGGVLPQVIMMMENLVEWRLTGEIKVLGENLTQRHFVHYKSHLTKPGFESGPATNRLSYGAAKEII